MEMEVTGKHLCDGTLSGSRKKTAQVLSGPQIHIHKQCSDSSSQLLPWPRITLVITYSYSVIYLSILSHQMNFSPCIFIQFE